MSGISVDANTLRIHGNLTRGEVVAMREAMLEAVVEPLEVVHLAGIESIDSAGVQLLCSLLRSWPGLRFQEPSVPVLELLARLGASRLLGGRA